MSKLLDEQGRITSWASSIWVLFLFYPFVFVLLWDRVLHSSSCPGALYVAKADLKLLALLILSPKFWNSGRHHHSWLYAVLGINLGWVFSIALKKGLGWFQDCCCPFIRGELGISEYIVSRGRRQDRWTANVAYIGAVFNLIWQRKTSLLAVPVAL